MHMERTSSKLADEPGTYLYNGVADVASYAGARPKSHAIACTTSSNSLTRCS